MSNNDIPIGYCQCGCGQKTTVPRKSNRHFGYIAGRPLRFIKGHGSRVRPKTDLATQFWLRVDKHGDDECWPWLGCRDKDGYGYFQHDHQYYRATHVSYRLANGNFSSDLMMRHTCDNPPCANPRHLIPGTSLDNRQDCIKKGRQAKGIDQHSAKLNEADVLAIRQAFSDKVPRRIIAIQYGITRENVYRIARRETWKHI